MQGNLPDDNCGVRAWTCERYKVSN